MRHSNHARTVLACCAFAAIATTGSQCCIAAPADADSESELDDSRQMVRFAGYTPFPRFIPSLAPSGTGPPTPSPAVALCIPDLYCSLASELHN
jgi:hypothetical protein